MNLLSNVVYWDTLQHRDWTFHLAATEKGLCRITLPNETLATLKRWLTTHVPDAALVHDERKLATYRTQIEQYLTGRRQKFSFPLVLTGTPFQVQVWRALLAIPFGTTWSYSELAVKIGRPTAVRAVAAANRANPIPIVIPCHRVIGKNGSLTGYRGGTDMKAKLLRLESITPVGEGGSACD
ncbi:methylated-DNA--[protein]-cysteine S-methyltransferase [Alicyclobacillus shizuokensis]|uniref:methylated-DNA--[protein]-cysteine S-methyltransferase n=1 Tax=Alicyclobacillus shizuokensis TaxID=392014 RepID=UPI0008356B5F|nr:methylated-DNA--[protein]-cysteine S-methyltransferase [Alicyclobacillus shizuokensis]